MTAKANRADKAVHAPHVLEGRSYCDCGREARRKKASSWVCERCYEIELWLYSPSQKSNKAGVRLRGV